MKRRLRVLMLGRHFWPHGSIDSAAFLFQLAVGLHRNGIHVEVVTPRYASSWPKELVIREIPVHRPAAAPRSDWSMGRYTRHLSSWLRDHAASFDVIMVDAIREEAAAAIEAARAVGCATVLRYGGWGDTGDWNYWQTSRAARRCAALGKGAERVISKNAASHRAFLTEGYLPSQIQRIDPGFPPAVARTAATRRAARQALATANGDLVTEDDTPVVVCSGRMTRQGGMNLLVNSARRLITRLPNLRLWFIGDGPHRDAMYERLRGDGVRPSIAMPGSFCGIEDVLSAADVFLQTDNEGLDAFLPAAVASELPVVSIDNESARSVIVGAKPNDPAAIEAASLVTWFDEATPESMRASLLHVLGDLDAHRDKASTLRRLLARSRPFSQTIDAYVTLIQQLVDQRTGRDSSVEAIS